MQIRILTKAIKRMEPKQTFISSTKYQVIVKVLDVLINRDKLKKGKNFLDYPILYQIIFKSILFMEDISCIYRNHVCTGKSCSLIHISAI